MFWADQIASELKGFQHVDDMKTPSGRIHVGALRGVIIHDLIYKALLDRGIRAVYTYVINDHDPMDSLPVYLDSQKFQKHMGEPLYKIPSPKPGFASFAQYWAKEFIKIFNRLGAKPEIIWSSELYQKGKMNGVIKEALDQAPKVLKIYQKIAGYPQKRKGWLPFQVICPKCGKVGTTEAFDWDGETVAFECLPDLVDWAQGCGYKGRTSPFNGNGKLLWKVDWPAHWKVLGVTYEGAGKDHFSKGGSWDMGRAFCQEVFNYPQPKGTGYEFFLVGGKKMSSSKGLGSSAAEVAEILPPELLRFLMVRTHFKKAIDFDPGSYTISDLFDEYDRCAKAWFSQGRKSDLGRIFELSQVGKVSKKKIEFPRFRDVATFVQMPGIDLKKQFPKADRKTLAERVNYVKIWLDGYAPKDFIFKVQEKLPEAAKKLSSSQKKYLTEVEKILQKSWKSEKELEYELYEVTKRLNLPSSEAFEAIYIALLGKPHGPKAAALLFSQDKKFLSKRLKEASAS